ncbi:ACT domain-containing protein [Oceanithermus sp.]
MQSGFRALEVEGPLEFNLTGVLAGISNALAAAGVPIFVLSSYDTDYILIRSELVGKAIASLKQAGYKVAH